MKENISANVYKSLLDFMEDMRLMRSNAHEYNVGTPGIEVRLMVDTLVEYSAALVRRIMQAAIDSQQKSCIDLVYTQNTIKYFDLVDNEYSWSSAASLLEAHEPPAITEFIRSNPFTIEPIPIPIPIPIQAVKTEEKNNLSQTTQSNSFSQVLKFSLKKPTQVESSDHVEDDTQFYFGNDEDDEDIEPFFDEFSEEEIEIIKQPPKKIKLLLSSQPTEEIEEQNDEYEDGDNDHDYDYDEYDEDGNRAEEYDDFYNYDEYSNGGILKLKTTKTKSSSYRSKSYLSDDASSNEEDYYASKSYSKSKSKSSRKKSTSSKQRSSKYDDYDQDDDGGDYNSYPNSTTTTKSKSKKKGGGGGGGSSSSYNEGDYYTDQYQPENSELAASASASGEGMYEWEICCETMLKRLGKHEYIDSKRRAADFYNPIVEQFPEIANDYLDIIK